MPKNHFRENRIRIQKAVLDFDFLIPLEENNLPLSLTESKATKSKLGEIIIHNVPTEEHPRPKSWLLELETSFPLFSQPPNIKTVEKALIVFGSDELSIFLLEMKNSLQPDGEDGVRGIKKKLEDSIGRISLLLPLYIFGKDFNEFKIQYKGIIFYNHNNRLTSAINEREDLKQDEFIKSFQNEKGICYLDDPIEGNHPVEVFFFNNPNLENSPESFSVNFEEFFFEEWQHTVCISGDNTCPILKELPKE